MRLLAWFRRPPGPTEIERPVLAVLTDQVRDMRARVDQLEIEWHDVLDKLLAREERERKRLSTRLKKATEDAAASEAVTPLPDDREARKKALRRRFTQTGG